MSWNQWHDIVKKSAEDAEQQQNDPPICCPNDAQTLQTGPDGKLFCPWDGWKEA